MTNKNRGDEPVFPRPCDPGEMFFPGLTKREYFAAKAMQGLLSDPEVCPNSIQALAGACVRYADALILELEKGK
jgi:hypothetical protein